MSNCIAVWGRCNWHEA